MDNVQRAAAALITGPETAYALGCLFGLTADATPETARRQQWNAAALATKDRPTEWTWFVVGWNHGSAAGLRGSELPSFGDLRIDESLTVAAVAGARDLQEADLLDTAPSVR